MAVLIAATVLVVSFASSSVDALVAFGTSGRWLLLIVLAAVALLVAARAGGLSQAFREPTMLLVGCLFGLGVLSAAWSVDAKLSVERSVSWGTLLVAAAAIGWAAARRQSVAESVLVGLLAGAVAVEAAGIGVLLIAHDDAVQAAGSDTPFRYRGLGENPNTVSMLAAVTLPLALWALFRYSGRKCRSLTLVALALSCVTIVFSGSRGALLAGFLGALTVTLTRGESAAIRSRLVHAGVVAALFVGGVALAQLPQPERVAVPSVTSAKPTTNPTPSVPPPFEVPGPPLNEDAGRTYSLQTRSLFSSSGRLFAWKYAISQANDRPLLGYGFGTEDVVFVDRVYNFQGGHTENSLIGMYLQLGLVGALLLVGSLGAAVFAGMRGFLAPTSARQRGVSAGAVGVVISGSALALVQSYVYAAGNVASLTVWTALFMFAFAGRRDGGASS